jgi:hypothetical protein
MRATVVRNKTVGFLLAFSLSGFPARAASLLSYFPGFQLDCLEGFLSARAGSGRLKPYWNRQAEP